MIETIVRKVYLSTRAGKHFMTKRAAIKAEARAIIESKYPRENPTFSEGYMECPGFHWTDMDRSDVLFRRLCRLIKKGMESNKIAGSELCGGAPSIPNPFPLSPEETAASMESLKSHAKPTWPHPDGFAGGLTEPSR